MPDSEYGFQDAPRSEACVCGVHGLQVIMLFLPHPFEKEGFGCLLRAALHDLDFFHLFETDGGDALLAGFSLNCFV